MVNRRVAIVKSVLLAAFLATLVKAVLAQSTPSGQISLLSYCGRQFQLELSPEYRVTQAGGRDYRNYFVTRSDVDPALAKLTVTLTSNPDIGPVISDHMEPVTVLGAKSYWSDWIEDRQEQKIFHRGLLLVFRSSKKDQGRCRTETRFILSITGSDEVQVRRISELAQNFTNVR